MNSLKIYSKPIFSQMLQNRGVSVDRTGNVFTEVSVDMTLEQTINVPAKYGL